MHLTSICMDLKMEGIYFKACIYFSFHRCHLQERLCLLTRVLLLRSAVCFLYGNTLFVYIS